MKNTPQRTLIQYRPLLAKKGDARVALANQPAGPRPHHEKGTAAVSLSMLIHRDTPCNQPDPGLEEIENEGPPPKIQSQPKRLILGQSAKQARRAFTVRLPKSLADRMDRVAIATDLTYQEILEKAVRHQLKGARHTVLGLETLDLPDFIDSQTLKSA